MKFLKYLTLTLAICAGPYLRAQEPLPERDFILSLGNLCEHIGTYQKTAKGDKNFCQFSPVISVGLDYPIYKDLSLMPQLSTGFPRESRDNNISKLTYSTLVNLVYSPHPIALSYKLGVGIFFTRMSGKGGTIALNNGLHIEEFQLPERVMTATNLIINAGVNYKFHSKISAEIYGFVFNLEDKLQRSFSLGLNLNYHFGEKLWNP